MVGSWLIADHDTGRTSQPGMAASGGIIHPATIADRCWAICIAFKRVEVIVYHGDAGDVLDLILPFDGEVVYVFSDPPYVGCTGYGWDATRAQVRSDALEWTAAGAIVAISEAEAIDLEEWHPLDLTEIGTGKPEWLTLSRPPVRMPAVQLSLLGGC